MKLRSRLHQCFDQRCLLRVANVDRDLHARALERFHEFAYSHCRTSCFPCVEYRVPHLFQLRVLTSGVWPCRQSLQHRLTNVDVRRSQLVFFCFFPLVFVKYESPACFMAVVTLWSFSMTNVCMTPPASSLKVMSCTKTLRAMRAVMS